MVKRARRTFAIISLISALESSAWAAEVETGASTSRTGPGLSFAYFGELVTHPGFAAGAKFSLFDGSWYDLTVGPTVGFYVHPRNHSGLFIDGELENRFTAAFGLFGTLGVAAGYYHTWLGGDGVYVRGDDGLVQKKFDWGRPHLKTGLSLGFGWDFEKNNLGPLRVFTRLDAFGQAPFNHAILPHVALQVGAVYRFGGSQ